MHLSVGVIIIQHWSNLKPHLKPQCRLGLKMFQNVPTGHSIAAESELNSFEIRTTSTYYAYKGF